MMEKRRLQMSMLAPGPYVAGPGGLQGWVVDGGFVRDDGFLGRSGRTDGFVEKARV
jgi:hypothetical protein